MLFVNLEPQEGFNLELNRLLVRPKPTRDGKMVSSL